ncbi:MAG: deoxyribonuclease V [Candidatus Latescibacterota bacterium]|nr:MAG: deoxyribonuclease V [Candidatus Latescibacterota bacterium]
MKIHNTHRWNLSYAEATALQTRLAAKIKLKRISLKRIRYVAGTDMAISKQINKLVGAAVVFSFPELEIIETQIAAREISFPYIPGLLSFREIPVLIDCLAKIKTPVDAIICDGQGIAHPRGIGLASHLGLLLQIPTIGCAKSLLVGGHDDVGSDKGDFKPLVYNNKCVGSVVRTRDRVKPVYVSPGYLADQAGSRGVVLACTTRYRLPEPTRYADRIAGDEKRRLESVR